MSEIDSTKTFLKNTIDHLEAKFIEDSGNDYYDLAKTWADCNEIGDFQSLTPLHTRYQKNAPLQRAKDTHIEIIAILIKAKESFKSGETLEAINLLFTFNFMLGKIDQNIIEEDGFIEQASEKAKTTVKKRYVYDDLFKKRICELLHKKRPPGGWKDRPTAARSILFESEKFLKEILHEIKLAAGPDSKSEPKLGSGLDPSNLESRLEKWMKTKGTEIFHTFNETASAAWLNLYPQPPRS